ncbi:MAG TPA: hypothetical protein PLX06_07655 [Fimbriimonadaceae bacterium]|nr:hypothetical protein [Fimbriimonadaceae bacterium]
MKKRRWQFHGGTNNEKTRPGDFTDALTFLRCHLQPRLGDQFTVPSAEFPVEFPVGASDQVLGFHTLEADLADSDVVLS